MFTVAVVPLILVVSRLFGKVFGVLIALLLILLNLVPRMHIPGPAAP